ncbi:Flagellar biosynthesis protein FlhA [Aliarcobacter thereius]|uniref:Flagellar biosynthesis protein FlhA n=2 Tax=Aliarcobacter thereius TaxID=544718 RepID=A0A1C0B943_9BACT|nr:flagellar biosynthesis protein FlhA [Aliarcobacter thereius]OCL88751.1 Flagellar biosynthesis protein FlhA [Aliarcobacter thereius]OCL92246.1 Flagellar biosynthesis protein FlhA [Aliarcobacter thereius]OCL94658.1 Flagellar biosynthesis protein FlhA [Aliarcobacter thereius LMG 24486]OCM00104.1 Flagellar biosynthesis protein FlhA [Aliarcobacter thereius]QBF15466.1 flagellar export apparatus, transmembrane gate complex, FlhA component [Aliarcobacter thereius LMG 24486]
MKFSFKDIFSRDLIAVALFLAMLAIIIIPLNQTAIDFFISISLALSFLILLISLYIQKPADLTTFPTLLLILVIFRLALSIATTRSILSEGHNGPDAVSTIITSFGEFVVGGNMVIGVVIFIILVLINFMVVTKGATRVAEVTARFTLDSMPGKQMAIDADLNAGFIDDKEAQERRKALITEANFYGAMDGSSKFVKGDAIAGIIITVVNIIGGLLVGIFQHGLSAGEAANIYTILTIGDGLVTQIPALLTSTATAIIITRSNTDEERFATRAVNQLIKDSKSLILVGIGLVLFAFVPGFPTGILSSMGILLIGLGYTIVMIERGDDNFVTRMFKPPVVKKIEKPSELKEQKRKEAAVDENQSIETVMKLEVLELKLGIRLLQLVQGNSELLDKIKAIRKNIAAELGFIIPQIRISDDTSLAPNEYQFYLKRIPLVKGRIEVDKYLAMGGLSSEKLVGLKVKEPVFNLDAIWITKELREEALMKGFTVVDAPTIISTHISEIIRRHAEDIITRQDIVDIIDRLKKDFPIVVEEAMKVASYGSLLKVCKDLLHEKIPIIDMLTIIEAIADIAEFTKAPEILLEHVRAKLYRLITQKYKDSDGILHIVTIKPELEQHFISKLQDNHGASQLMLSIAEINNLVTKTKQLIDTVEKKGFSKIAMVVDPVLRKRISEIYEKFGMIIPVLSHAELDSKANFAIEGTLEF